MSVGLGGVARGCGVREAGGIYLCSGTSDDGLPIEYFLLDPPVLVPPHVDLPARGVTTIERDGIHHVADHVGSQHYPNVADFVEEGRRFGVSRRISKKFDFSLLSKNSRILLAHSRAWINEWDFLRQWDPDGQPYPCPRADLHDVATARAHIGGQSMCIDLWWRDLIAGDPTGAFVRGGEQVRRTMPSFDYLGTLPIRGIETTHAEAFFLSLPIERVEVVRNPLDADDEKRALDAAGAAQLPLEVVDL